MRIVAFRHSQSDGLGLVAGVLDAHGIAWQYADLYDPPAETSAIEDASALIVLGGSMSANDDLPFIRREIDCIRSAVTSRKPLLGICLGAQLIAKALGAKVYANSKREIGWESVTFTEAAQNDPVFHGLRSEVTFHWHGETFDLPTGAELLASSAACRHQAFRFGDRVYGLQFHPEVMPQMISQWCREDDGWADREATQAIDPYANSARARDLAQVIFGRWCESASARTDSRRRTISG